MILLSFTDLFISEYFNNDVLEVVTNQVSKQVQLIAIGLGTFLFLTMTGYNYIKTSLGSVLDSDSDGSIIDKKELVRTIIVLFLISIYSVAILPAINGSVRGFNALTQVDSKQKEDFSRGVKEYMDNQELAKKQEQLLAAEKIINDKKETPENIAKAEQLKSQLSEDPKSTMNQISQALEYAASTPFRLRSWLDGQAMNFVMGIIKLIVGVLAVIIFKILLVLGPLALAVSIVPAYRGQADVWFGTLITTGLVITTMHLIDCFSYGLISMVWDSKKYSFEDGTVVATINIALIVVYLMTFWLTSKWIGKGDAGRFISKTVGLAAMAAGAAGGAGLAAAKGIGSTASGAEKLANVLSAAKKGASGGKGMFDDHGTD